jgi:hypothetical protein
MIPAPILWEAPVVMAVFRGLLMVVYLENVLLLEKFDGQAQATLGSADEVALRSAHRRRSRPSSQPVIRDV